MGEWHVGTLVRCFAVTWRLYGKTGFRRSPSYSREKMDDYTGSLGIAHWIFKCYPLFPAPINPALFALALFRSFPCIEKSIRSPIFDFHHVPYEIFPKPGCWSPRYRMSETGNWKSSLEAMLESLYTKASCMIHLV